jgi:hypothetical protein
MAKKYDNNLRGIISVNDRKEKNTHPDYKGTCEINNQEYWISGWIKERKDGSGKFLSLNFEAKDQQSAPARQNTIPVDAPF